MGAFVGYLVSVHGLNLYHRFTYVFQSDHEKQDHADFVETEKEYQEQQFEELKDQLYFLEFHQHCIRYMAFMDYLSLLICLNVKEYTIPFEEKSILLKIVDNQVSLSPNLFENSFSEPLWVSNKDIKQKENILIYFI